MPFRASLDFRDRASIVHETSNFNLATNQGRAVGRLPTDVEVKTLMLTTMGGWLDCELDVANPPVAAGLTLEQWKHRATMGRDHYVKVVYAGYLYPFGHKASVIKVTERRVVSENGHATAFLFQRVYVLVRQELREFGAGGSPTQRSTMPLRWVRVLTHQTPPLTQPVPIQVQPPGASAKGLFFVPNVSPTDNGSNAGPAEAPFQFRMMAADAQDNVVEFSGPLIFIEADNLTDPKFAGDILTAADTKSPDFELRGQKIAYAPYRTTGDTALQTTSLTFDASWFHGGDDANFLPTLRKTKAVVPAMSAFTEQADPVALSYPPGFDLDDFKNSTKNPAQIFLATATSQVMNFSSQSDKSGGFLSPDVAITALSRINGPMGGDVTAMMKSTGAFDLSTFFGNSAKLFGIVSLAELLATIAKMDALPKFVTRAVDEATALLEDLNRIKSLLETQAKSAGDSAQDLANAVDGAATALLAFAHDPGDDALTNTAAKSLHDVSTPLAAVAGKIEKSEIPRAQREQASALLRRVAGALNDAAGVMTMFSKLFNGLAHPSSVSASLDWSTTLESWPPAKDMDNPIFVPGGDRKLSLAAQIEAPLKGGAPTSLVSCSLPPFSLNLVGPVDLISIHVKTMEFSVAPGKKPDVNVELEDNGIEFTGPLGFIETLKEIIPMDGFSDPPYLDISPAGINAGFDLALPDLAMGVFALSNISVGARLVVPFVGESLEFQFYFARRENPFRLAVALFAGGGFVGITLTPAGLKVIEAAFEFGAAAEVDFGVASGSVSVMAGIYFRLELAGSGQNITLTGYFRARGEVSVLALVSICIEIYLELSYLHESGCDKAVGQAVITLEVSICFLSFSVKLECERKFAGSKGDPSFAQVMSPYVDYRGAAFAPWDQYCNAFAPETV